VRFGRAGGSTIRGIGRLSEQICGDCVPREYAPEMRIWMDRISDFARELNPHASSGG
jgi:hypothetical protein